MFTSYVHEPACVIVAHLDFSTYSLALGILRLVHTERNEKRKRTSSLVLSAYSFAFAGVNGLLLFG